MNQISRKTGIPRKKPVKPVKPVISENGYFTHISRNYRLFNYILLFLVF